MATIGEVVGNLPASVLGEMIVDPDRIVIPVNLSRDEVMTKLTPNVSDIGLTHEKALYLACTIDQSPLPTINELLFRLRRL